MTTHDHLIGSGLVSESPLMREVLGQIQKAAASRAGVMLMGESGTGRGRVARAIHEAAHDGAAPFVVVECETLPAAEAERQIFGAPGNGNGSGAQRRPGAPEVVCPGSLLHSALGGTVLFTHFEELPARVQARLATLFRDREFIDRPRAPAQPFTARPIAAVDHDYQAHLDEGRVRLDLHRRFAEVRIALPSLRDRREDIPALAQIFLARACGERGVEEKTLDSGALALISALPWHGNAVELRELVGNVAQAAPECVISLQMVLEHISLEAAGGLHASLGAPLRDARQRFEREYIAAVVAQHHGRIPDAAKSLGIQRTNLYRKLRALRLPRQIA
jgi:two-component system, NtrC family, nitrogen regulation response regulator NtrX